MHPCGCIRFFQILRSEPLVHTGHAEPLAAPRVENKKKRRRFEKDTADEQERYGESFLALATKSNIYAADICLADRRFSHR